MNYRSGKCLYQLEVVSPVAGGGSTGGSCLTQGKFRQSNIGGPSVNNTTHTHHHTLSLTQVWPVRSGVVRRQIDGAFLCIENISSSHIEISMNQSKILFIIPSCIASYDCIEMIYTRRERRHHHEALPDPAGPPAGSPLLPLQKIPSYQVTISLPLK